MEAIKKKMAALKIEKDNALDRADAGEVELKNANHRGEKVRRYGGDLCR
jgi:tropomyosin-1